MNFGKVFEGPFAKLAALKNKGKEITGAIEEGARKPLNEGKIDSISVIKPKEGGGFNLVAFCSGKGKDEHHTFYVAKDGTTAITPEAKKFLQRNGIEEKDIYQEVANIISGVEKPSEEEDSKEGEEKDEEKGPEKEA